MYVCDINSPIYLSGNQLCNEYYFECLDEVEWGNQDNSNCDCLGFTYGDAIFDECGICDGVGIVEDFCDCAENIISAGSCSCQLGLIDDIFISEYHEGSFPNPYIEIYNGTNSPIDLTGYELWILRSENDMTWEPSYDSDDEDWESDFWVLLFNSDTSMTDVSMNLPVDGDLVQRVDISPIPSGQTLMVIRDGEDEDFEFVGRNFVVWDRLVKLTGDDPIALRKNGAIIDKVGDDENVSSSGWDVGEGSTNNHTLIRKSSVLSGNIDWTSSALYEWNVYEEDTFIDIFSHTCQNCIDSYVDLNNDLSIDIFDVLILINCVLSDLCEFCSDYNEDNSIDILDIIYIVNIILE